MPGVIMENGFRNGLHTNHDRDQRQNGVNGISQPLQVKGGSLPKLEPKQNMTPTSPGMPNGTFAVGGGQTNISNGGSSHGQADSKIALLPPELLHMTAGFVPWSNLLTRQTQSTFGGMTSTIQSLSEMSIPSLRANGYNPQNPNSDDNSDENLQKKVALLKYLESAHADWVKQLALAQWSRRAHSVSRLVDLQTHLRGEKWLYDQLIGNLCETKRSLLGATLPNPDLRTALEVLSTGTVSWMPELGFIPPVPLTAGEILNQLEELNTVLSIRLNIYEHETMPFHFSKYSISSGRVTFQVAGEFDVDLAVASDDPQTQFWFIDLRFTFSPQPADMDSSLRFQIEQKINDVLLQDGLIGCYKYLHELVLTRKILGLRKQAMDLAHGKWIDGLKIEQLNRAISIQYWVDRYAKGPKSWILLAVHSGRPKNGRSHPRDTSRLYIRWFRDGKEVSDEEIPFDTTTLSAEGLLETVIARHVNHILTSLHDRLRSRPIFAAGASALNLTGLPDDPSRCMLFIQLTHSQQVTIKIEPTSGRFILGPAHPRIAEAEYKLNTFSQDPVNDAHNHIDVLRCTLIIEELHTYATSVGWRRNMGPKFRAEALKPLLPEDVLQTAWFQRAGWTPNWYLAITSGRSGEKYWLFESLGGPDGPTIGSHICVPIKSKFTSPSYAFMATLSVFVAAILTHYANAKTLNRRGAFYTLRSPEKPQKGIFLPSVHARLSQLLPSRNVDPRTRKSWAKDVVRITFQGLESTPESNVASSPASPNILPTSDTSGTNLPEQQAMVAQKPQPSQDLAVVITEARMSVPLPSSFVNINEQVERDIAFHPDSGAFAFRLKTPVGQTVVPALIERLTRVERLVEYVQILQSYKPQLSCDSLSLGMISFSYTTQAAGSQGISKGAVQQYKARIDFGNVDQITLLLNHDDPHLRILDLLNQILNSSQGFRGVAKLLPVTAPALRGLNEVQKVWANLSQVGECFVLVRATEQYVIRYAIKHAGVEGSGNMRQFNFSLKLQDRKGQPYWHLQRADTLEREGDDLEVELQKIWNAVNEKWLGMRLSGVATPSGVEALLLAVNDAVKDVASNASAAAKPAQSDATAIPQQAQQVEAAKKPQRAPTSNSQQRTAGNAKQQANGQRPNPNQGKNGQPREVVILD